MGRHRKLTAIGMGAGLLSLAGASIAWACTYLAPVAYVSNSPAEAPAGTTIQVTTHNANAMGPGLDSRLVWEDANGNFLNITLSSDPSLNGDSATVPVTIPNSAPGHYFINLFRGLYRATPADFAIPRADGTVPVNAQNSGSADTGTYGFGPTSAGNQTAAGSVAAGTVSDGKQAQQASTARGAGTGSAAQSGPAAVKSGLFGSASSAPAANSATPIAGAPVQPAAGGNVPADKVLGDLWGGFARGKTNSQAPSLIPASSGPGVGLTVGLLTAGLVALFAGFGVAEFRRSRATVVSSNS